MKRVNILYSLHSRPLGGLRVSVSSWVQTGNLLRDSLKQKHNIKNMKLQKCVPTHSSIKQISSQHKQVKSFLLPRLNILAAAVWTV